MIILTNIFNSIYKNVYNSFLTIIILVLLFIIMYKIYKLYIKQYIYIGCLYSKSGLIGQPSYNNYQMLLEAFRYSINKYNVNIAIVPIYVDLGNNPDNYSKWVEECVIKYNVKYFFGCWSSVERKTIIPLLEKFNVRLFYPLRTEGFEYCKNIYYFGPCPNQYIIPSLEYLFDKYYFYQDVYIIGNNSIYSQILIKIISKLCLDKKQRYEKKLTYIKLYELPNRDYSDFIMTMFKTTPKGAILINLFEGIYFVEFTKQLFIMYKDYFVNTTNKLIDNNTKLIKYLNQNIDNDKIQLEDRYPSVSFGINNYNISKENMLYSKRSYNVSSFTDVILTDKVYQIYVGNNDVKRDLDFLIQYIKDYNINIGDAQYSTFISTLFFVKTIKEMLNKGENINDTNVYDKYMKGMVTSVSGNHILNTNHHISMHLYINLVDENGRGLIEHQSFNNLVPNPFMGIYDKIFTTNANYLYYSGNIQ